MMTVREAAVALQAAWTGEDIVLTGVSTDSRTLKKGDLFVALMGERFDGSQFMASVLQQGAAAAMIGQGAGNSDLPAGFPLICVKDTRLGLGQLAAYWRNRFTLPLIGVTGSNGKTTVKEMIASILRTAAEDDAASVLATEGNLNNDIGVPQMLLRMRDTHRYAVIEMGMNHRGEISYLTKLARPTVAIITNAGAAHIEGLGSVEAVAMAKGEIFEGLDPQGTAVINADDDYAPLWRQLAGERKIVDFGLLKTAQVSAEYQANPLFSRIQLRIRGESAEVDLQVPGIHNIRNALAAAAVAAATGIKKEWIISGLANFKGVKGRLQVKQGLHQAMLIDDTYNANPESVRAALAVLALSKGRKILILGDMGELGRAAIDLHRTIGREARTFGLDQLLTLGELSGYAAEEFGKGGRHFRQLDELLNETEKLLAKDVTLLVKGSRFMQMERVVNQLVVH